MHDWHAIVRRRLDMLHLHPARVEDIVNEIALHIAEHHAELTASGMDDEEASAAALAWLDDPARLADEIARADRPRPAAPLPPAGGGRWWRSLASDVRYALRLLVRAPGFTAIAVLTLALGTGANTAIFSVLNAVLIRPLPFADADRVVLVGEREPDGSAGSVGYATYVDWRERTHGFAEMAAIEMWTPTLATSEEPRRVPGMRVTAGYFRVLGVQPALGRDFRPADDTPAARFVVLLSDGLWRRQFGADPGVVGRTVTINDHPYTVIGVMPASFEPLVSEHFYQRADIWAPLGYDTSLPYACRDCFHLMAIGRLQPSAPAERVRADLDAVQADLRRKFPTVYQPDTTMTLEPLATALDGRIRPVLVLLAAAVAVVLLIACANVAHLMLARAAGREHDLALRAALGAGRWRLVRTQFAECGLVALAGGTLGIAVSAMGVPALIALAPASAPRVANAGIDVTVLAFTLLVSLGAAVLTGVLPAVSASRVRLAGVLQSGSARLASRSAARRVLVTADVALAVVLLIGAGLMIRSMTRLLAVDPGFDPHGVLTFQVSLIGQPYADDAKTVAATGRLLDRLRALPGANVVAAASQVPLGHNFDSWGFHVQGRTGNPATDPSVQRYGVTPGYFAAMRIPLHRGRLITAADRADTERVIVIGEETARRVFPNADPVGQLVKIGGTNGPWRKIVGVVGDVHHETLAAPPTLQMYTPETQFTDSYLTIVIRAAGDPLAVLPEARRTVYSTLPGVPVYEAATLQSLVDQSMGPRRFVMTLLALFGALALLLTAVGVYGVVSFAVARQTREIGIRAALGASRRAIVGFVLGQGAAMLAVGVGVGLLLTLLGVRYLEASLYQIGPRDPWTYVASAALIAGIALLAQIPPIVRALGVNPVQALKAE